MRRALVTLIALVAACDGGDAEPAAVETTPGSTVVPTTVPADQDDGVLRIGLLLPRSGESAELGQRLVDAALVAAEAVNTAGGVLGESIEIVDGVDEGETAASARDAIATLLDADVDAVIGPASSTVALATLGDLMSAGVLTCSPTATALALDEFPGRELFIRTAPSDSLQATELAQEADDTGARSAAVTYLDDPFGRALGEATVDALRARGLTVDEEVPFAAEDESLADEANQISASDAGVIVVLGDGEHGSRMLAALGEATGIVPGDRPPAVLVNDAIRRPPSRQLIADLAGPVRESITGVSPLAFGQEPNEPPGAFATNAADCLNLIALAAVAAGSDNPAEMRAEIVDISDSGANCRTFADCAQLLLGNTRIDYDGPGGRVRLGPDGDPLDARFDRFGFDETGTDVSLSPVPAIPPIAES